VEVVASLSQGRTAAAQCGLFTYKSVPVILEPPCIWVQYTISCITQSNAPEDGQNCCPKHVELIWIYQYTIIVASSWLSSLPSLVMMHRQTNIQFLRNEVIISSQGTSIEY